MQYATLTLLTFSWCLISSAQKTPKPKPPPEKDTLLVGRVLAWKETFGFGAGVGPLYQVFIFGAEKDRGATVTPIKVAYAFFKSDGPLPDGFFDYSKQYELKAVRDTRCDESVEELSYVKSVEHESRKPLPPVYVLRFLVGAPKGVLKSDAVLACFVLRPGKLKILSQNHARGPDAMSDHDGAGGSRFRREPSGVAYPFGF